MMQLYYFYDPIQKMYLMQNKTLRTPNSNKANAGHFTDQDHRAWGEKEGYEKIPVPDDVIMRKIGAPTLPGFE